MIATVRKTKLGGEVLIPASKSHTIRALLIASLAQGRSVILNPLDSADARSCVEACRLLGASVAESSRGGERALKVTGTNGRPAVPSGPIDVGNSGTTLYLAASVAALADRPITFTGDGQIQARPAGALLASLADLGAEVSSDRGNGKAPFTIRGPWKGGKTSIECPTSQYLSSLLIAAPIANAVETLIEVPLLHERPYVEMTLRWLEEQKIELVRKGLELFRIPGGQSYRAFEKRVPGDFSSATFFLCAAAVTRSELTLLGLDMADSQGDKAVVGILESLGCRIETGGYGIKIAGGRLRGRDIDMNAIPDALPALAATACYAEGTTRLLNVPQARLKETDRIAVMAAELSKLGADVRELPDGLEIRGGAGLKGGLANGRSDHRAVMALAVAGLGAEGETRIETAEAAGVTFPGFFELLEKAGR